MGWAKRADLRSHSCAANHVQVLCDQFPDHRGGSRRIIRFIAIEHHVHISFDIRKHPSDHEAFTTTRLRANDGARRKRASRSLVARIVVVDIYGGRRQYRPDTRNDGSDRGGLVIAGNHDGNIQRGGHGWPGCVRCHFESHGIVRGCMLLPPFRRLDGANSDGRILYESRSRGASEDGISFRGTSMQADRLEVCAAPVTCVTRRTLRALDRFVSLSWLTT